ncbi:condensation domain-containing protein [Lentzea kentuckyensis]|uniref:condensation domain-containing protein n=1 Tax=Lentzea kentuckyensis TaxID=360086 RepID=UPI000A3AB919|nr:condensation domain-containing protein [Lentzea kentuckyensis]
MRELPLAHAQEALWFLHRLAPDSAAHNTGVAVRVLSTVDEQTLADAVIGLAARHELLRSTFRDGIRVLGEESRVALVIRDLPGADEDKLATEVRNALTEPLRLDQGAFRVVLLRRSPGDAVLLIVAHHIVTDATSAYLLLRDLLHLLTGTPLPAPRGDYAGHVQRERDLIDGPRGAELAAHWQDVCRGSAAAELLTDRPRAERPAFTGSTCRVVVPPEVTTRIRELARESGVTPFAVLLGSFQGLLFRTTRRRDFLLGCPTTTRSGNRDRDVVGNFVNTLLFRARFTAETTFREAALAVAGQVRAGVGAAGYPFSLLAARVGAGGALCRITFNLLATAHLDPALRPLLDSTRAEDSTEFGGLELRPYPLPQQEGQLDLTVDVMQHRDSFVADFRYDAELFDHETINRLAGHYLSALTAAVAAPDGPVAKARLW